MSCAVRTDPDQMAFSCASLDRKLPVAACVVAEATSMTMMPAAMAAGRRSFAARTYMS